jgi:hypothetical protein
MDARRSRDARKGGRDRFILGAVAAVIVFAAGLAARPAQAQFQAVMEPNWNIGGAGGEIGGDGAGVASGRLDVPLGMVGLQIDPVVGVIGGDGYGGAGGNLFFRSPLGSIGPVVSFQGFRGSSLEHYGLQGELYTGFFDFAVRGGYQEGANVRSGGFFDGHVGLYLTDDVEVGAGTQFAPDRFTQTFDAEFQPHWAPVPSLSLFTTAAIGGQGSSRVLLGARWHWGSDQTLKDRHHTDDVWDPLPEPFKRPQ